MTKFSKTTIQKLKLHLEKLKNSTESFEQNVYEISNKKSYQRKILTKNQNVSKALLIESIFLNLDILNFSRSSLFTKFLLKNRKFFVGNKLNNNSYLYFKLPRAKTSQYNNLKQFLYSISKNLKIKGQFQLNKVDKILTQTNRKISKYSEILILYLKRWYIYLNRFIILTLIHFIPFIQLSTKLFYTYPNPIIANSVISSMFQIFPLLMRLISWKGGIIANETFGFLLIGFYYKLFIISYKQYKIPRKVAFQGTFAIALMLLNYCVLLSSEIITVIYKFTKRLFFYTKNQDLELFRDDINFYINDLEEFRYFKERFLQWGESIFSLSDLTRAINLSEASTIISLLGVIALLYNYVYFILRGEKPIIPVVTKTVRRMMVDRNSDEL